MGCVAKWYAWSYSTNNENWVWARSGQGPKPCVSDYCVCPLDFKLFLDSICISKSNGVGGSIHVQTAGKWWKCESYFGALTPWLADWAGYELGGLAPHQCRWAGVVWSPRCRDCVMGCLRGELFFIDPSFLVNSHFDYSRAWIPVCSLIAALLYCCFPSNLSTTTQGAIVNLRRASSELWTLFIWSV